MKGEHVFSYFLHKLGLVTMGAACVMRFNLFSMAYGILLLFAPIVPNPTLNTMSGVTGKYLSVVLATSGSIVLCQMTFQSYLLGQAGVMDEPYGAILGNCSTKEKTLRQIGFQRISLENKIHILHLIGPDVAVFCIFLMTRMIYKNHLPKPYLSWETLPLPAVRTIYMVAVTSEVSIFLITLFLSVCSVIHPSGLSTVYLLLFFCIMTSWSYLIRLPRRKHVKRISAFLSAYTAVHLIVLYLYQFHSAQDILPRQTTLSRLMGLTAVVIMDCSYKPWGMKLNSEATWPMYVNPAVVYMLYYVAVVNYKDRMKKKPQQFFTMRGLPEENISQHNKGIACSDSDVDDLEGLGERGNTPHLIFYTPQPSSTDLDIDEALIQRRVASELFAPRMTAREFMQKQRNAAQDLVQRFIQKRHTDISEGTFLTNVIGGTTADDESESMSEKIEPSITKAILLYISRQSYVCTLIVMMVWSIAFHNWMTLVFLLVSCIIWVTPKKRHVVLKLSPYFLIYALLIFLSNYIFSLQLLEEELPTSIRAYNLVEFGIVRRRIPVQALAVQLGLMLVFWMTLRERNKEKVDIKLAEASEEYGRHEEEICVIHSKSRIRRRMSTAPSAAVGRKHVFYCTKEQLLKGILTCSASVKTVWDYAVRCWIYVCMAILFVIAVNGRVSFFRIIYMMFFLGYIICFQMSFPMWCVISLGFWWIVIVYTMIILCAIYIYQFRNLDVLGVSAPVLYDIGLEQYDTATLYLKLLTPTLFLIACNIQVHYLHRPLLEVIQSGIELKQKNSTSSIMSRICRILDVTIIEVERCIDLSLNSMKNPSNDSHGSSLISSTACQMGNVDNLLIRKNQGFSLFSLLSPIATMATKFSALKQKHSATVWRFVQVHVHKVIMFITFICFAIYEVSASHTVIVLVLLLFDLPFHHLQRVTSHCCLILVAAVILTKTVYQLQSIPEGFFLCGSIDSNETLGINATDTDLAVSLAAYTGFVKVSDIFTYINVDFIVLLMLLFESVIIVHQAQYYRNCNTAELNVVPQMGIIFPHVDCDNANKDVYHCLMFFLNYGFYKFGLEICYSVAAINMVCHLDYYSVFYGLVVGTLQCINRQRSAYVWPIHMSLFVGTLTLQCIAVLGLPLHQCFEFSNTGLVRQYLADYARPSNKNYLIGDYIYLLFVCQHFYVFIIETNPQLLQSYGGGSNVNICIHRMLVKEVNPVADFTSNQSTMLDYIQLYVFKNMFWVSMCCVFLSGASEVSLLSVGLYFGCFIWLWVGPYCFIRSTRRLQNLWSVLLAYSFAVIFLDCCRQVAACPHIASLTEHNCWVIQLFHISCTHTVHGNNTLSEQCFLEKGENSNIWDVLSFICLLIQLRIFHTYYFQHVVLDLYVQDLLSHRGGDLINVNLLQHVEQRKFEEKQVLLEIKSKMQRIKTKQEHTRQRAAFVSSDHYKVIRSGDYYMFEEDEELDDDIVREKMQEKDQKTLAPLQLMNLYMQMGAEETLAIMRRNKEPINAQDAARKYAQIWLQISLSRRIWKQKKSTAWSHLRVLWELWLRLIDAITARLDLIVTDYRKVAVILDQEKRVEKQKLKMRALPWIVQPCDQSVKANGHHKAAIVEIKRYRQREDPPRLLRFTAAIKDALLSLSEFLCYFVMILNPLLNASVLSLPFPISVFLWAMLSVPRPDTVYWITMIVYTEIVLLVKYFFRFGFFSWNTGEWHSSDPLYLPRIIGIDRLYSYEKIDMVLLFVLFFHRSLLKSKGIWHTAQKAAENLDKAKQIIEEDLEQDIRTDKEQTALDVSNLSLADFDYNKPDPAWSQQTRWGQLAVPFQRFYIRITEGPYNIVTDVYTWMFLCDAIGFIIVSFSYKSFAPVTESHNIRDVASAIKENRVPSAFLFMLLSLFIFMLVDRVIYLRRLVFGKLILQVVLVISVHVWMFFILPSVTNRAFSKNFTAQLWYFFKCLYFGLSAYQIRSRYPARILGNFLTKQHNYTNLFFFKIFQITPFMLEIRHLMDWMWTDTALGLYSWVQMEDIYNNVFIVACFLAGEDRYVTPRATKRSPIIKYGLGGILLFLLFLIIWFPMLLFSFGGTVFVSKAPLGCSLSIQLDTYKAVFEMDVQQHQLYKISSDDYESLKDKYKANQSATSFLSTYTISDVYIADIDGQAASLWSSTPPNTQGLYNHLMGNNTFVIYVTVSIPSSTSGEPYVYSFPYNLTSTPDSRQKRNRLAQMILPSSSNSTGQGNSSNAITIPNIFPRYLYVSAKGVKRLTNFGKEYLNLMLQVNRIDNSSAWWQVNEFRKPNIFQPKSAGNTYTWHSTIRLVTFNERVAPSILATVTSYGVVGLYVSLVFMVGKLVRMMTENLSHSVIYTEMPYVGRILRLCQDIYLVRENGDMALEEELFAKLIFLYRSPETLIKITRPKAE